MTTNQPHLGLAAALLAGAAALHAYEQFVLSAAPDAWSYAWSLLPYILCLIAVLASESAIPAIAGICVALAFDGLAHYDAFINPRGSTGGLALFFVPLWSTIVFVPAAILISQSIIRRRATRNAP